MKYLTYYAQAKYRACINRLREDEGRAFKFWSFAVLFVVYWACAFFLVRNGSRFIINSFDFGPLIFNRIIYLFTFTYFSLAAAGTVLVCESILFASRDMDFLITLPVPALHLLASKWFEICLLSVFPLSMLSFPIAAGISWIKGSDVIVLMMMAAVLVLLTISAVATGILVFIAAKALFRKLNLSKPLAVCAVCAVAGILKIAGVYSQRYKEAAQAASYVTDIVMSFFSDIDFIFSSWAPSAWYADVINGILSGRLKTPGYSWMFALLFPFGIALVVMGLSSAVSDMIKARSAQGARYKSFRLSPDVSGFTQFFVKDLRISARDPQIYMNLFIFFGILVVYFFNLRQFKYDEGSTYWRSIVQGTNYSTIILILSTLTVRFFFPVPSMEIRRQWINGFSRYGWRDAMMFKLASSSAVAVLAALVLNSVSNTMLKTPWIIHAASSLSIAPAAVILSCVAVGAGIYFRNPYHQDMARIVNSFGGIVTFLVSMCVVLVSVCLFVIPLYFGWGIGAASYIGMRVMLVAGCAVHWCAAAAAVYVFVRYIPERA